MRIKLEQATAANAPQIAALRTATAERLTAQHGKGPWSQATSDKGVLFYMREGRVFIAKHKGSLIATLTFTVKKPWAIDKKYFSPVPRPLYLIAMAIAPDWQRKSVGQACLTAAQKICKNWPADAIRLDAYDAPAGAGPFYQKCGFQEVGRASYRGTALIYFELLL